MICTELQKTDFSHIHAQFGRYRLPLSGGSTLISGWFKQVQEMKDCQGTACFEAFFYTWIAFNGWAVCVTDDDRDAACIDALIRSDKLCQEFLMFTITDSTSPLALASVQFATFWPIFNVRNLRRSNILYLGANRENTIRTSLKRHIETFAPKCVTKHRDNGEPIPIDWPYILVALYQVRCIFSWAGMLCFTIFLCTRALLFPAVLCHTMSMVC